RKRKWDLDDQGKEAPPVSTASKSAKVDPSSDASESSAPSPTPSNSDSIDPNVAAGSKHHNYNTISKIGSNIYIINSFALIAVAAAKINAMLAAKGIQVPAKPLIITPKLDISENGTSKKDSDLEFTHDITINDCKNRYLLTKGATQQQLLATEKDPPLYLHVTASTKEALNAAINKISELMEQTFTPAPSTPTPRPPGQHLGFVQYKVFVGIEPDRTFNARAKIVGPQGAYVKHIQQETGAKVQLKGRGSGYVEPTSGTEAFEPLHIHITAKKLCEDLINTVKIEWDKHKAQQAAYSSYGRSPYPRPPVYGQPGTSSQYNASTTSNAYTAGSQNAATATAWNPYNPYNQSRYYPYSQYPYYQQTAAQAVDASYYYGYAGYQTAANYQTAGYQVPATQAPTAPSASTTPSTTTSPPTSPYEDKKQGSSYHAVPPPDSYESEVGK
ncbi:11623_t:CDS:2, partial [Racocetra fulgida]